MWTTDLPRNDLDLQFVRISEECVYIGKVGKILDWLAENPREDLVHFDYCTLCYPYNELQFFEAHEWSGAGNNSCPIGWHNVEVFREQTVVRGNV